MIQNVGSKWEWTHLMSSLASWVGPFWLTFCDLSANIPPRSHLRIPFASQDMVTMLLHLSRQKWHCGRYISYLSRAAAGGIAGFFPKGKSDCFSLIHNLSTQICPYTPFIRSLQSSIVISWNYSQEKFHRFCHFNKLTNLVSLPES